MSYKSRFCWTTPYRPGQYEEIFKHPSPGKLSEIERARAAGGDRAGGGKARDREQDRE